MIRKLIMTGIAMATIAISSCSEDTTDLGNSLTYGVDQFVIKSDTFDIETRSIVADSVLSRSNYSYLGRMKDPETGSYVTADYTTQLAILEDDDYFVPRDVLLSLDEDGNPASDSCFMNIVINSYMGDSLAAMKLNMRELGKPITEDRLYYTNFNPAKAGYIREDGIFEKKIYSITDLTDSDSLRALKKKGAYFNSIRIPLNDPYTDKDGVTYKNYGSYIMRKYYDHPEYFKNSQTFTEKVCPGFYFQTTDGLGVMAEVLRTQLEVNMHFKVDTNVVVSAPQMFNGTEEVLQTSHFVSDMDNIKRLASDETCTYLKTPEGIFTEVTLPVEAIKQGHENDTIASARIVFRRMNDRFELSDEVLEEPANLLMIERDSLYSFFEGRSLPNNKTSYLATYNKDKNSYTFNNISGLINHMYARRGKEENWNKAVLVPVQVTRAAATSTTTAATVATVSNELKMTSVRLVGGKQNQHAPVRISVVYNQNK